jgi:hypothetical protein
VGVVTSTRLGVTARSPGVAFRGGVCPAAGASPPSSRGSSPASPPLSRSGGRLEAVCQCRPRPCFSVLKPQPYGNKGS